MTDARVNNCLLGVETSCSGRRWLERPIDERYVQAAIQRFGMPDILARILSARGVELDAIDDYLNPRLRELLPDPSSLADMDRATARLVQAILDQEKIVIFGDYDVDGATSTALFLRYMAMIGVAAGFYIPDRMTEGYGPNEPAMEKLHRDGYQLIVTVDCGTMAHKALARAEMLGLDVIVVDHHQIGEAPPKALALVNPRRADDASGLGHLAAVGVSFMVLVGLNRSLRQAGYFAEREEPNLLDLLDLVALGTVCDVVPLRDLNRAFVLQGLKILQSRQNVGLAALADVSRAQPPMGTYEIGFMLGPRVNAGGRVGESSLGPRLLLSSDKEEVTALAMRLDAYNTERRALEAKVLDRALVQLEAATAGYNMVPPALIAADQDWHPGVIGIVAGRLKDRFYRPVFVISFDADGAGKGSGRSIPGFDLGQMVAKAVGLGLIQGGGGHAMAAGVTLTQDQLQGFRDFLLQECALAATEASRALRCDAALQPSAATRDLLDMIDRAGPYGAGNPEPRFVIPSAQIAYRKEVSGGHIQCTLADAGRGKLKAIAFASLDETVRNRLLTHQGPLHIVGALRADDWQGRRGVQLMIQDIAIP